MAVIPGPGLGRAAAGFHAAPATRAISSGIQKQPTAAFFRITLLDAVELIVGQQLVGVDDDGVGESGVGPFGSGSVPLGAAVDEAKSLAGASRARAVLERGEIGSSRLPAFNHGPKEAVQDFPQRDQLRQQPLRPPSGGPAGRIARDHTDEDPHARKSSRLNRYSSPGRAGRRGPDE